jgi:hypothetical protein
LNFPWLKVYRMGTEGLEGFTNKGEIIIFVHSISLSFL